MIEDVYVKYFKKRLLTKLSTDLNNLLKLKDSEDYNDYDSPSYHSAWYDARVQTYNSIIAMVKEAK